MATAVSPVAGPMATSSVPPLDMQSDNPRGPFAGTTPRMESITQMHAAAVNGEKQVLSRLIAASGMGEVDTGDQFGRNPLMYCVLADRLECAELLLKAGSQVNFRDKGGRTALHWAAHKGNYRLMKLLLSRGADCREKDNEGQTPLHLCTRHKLPKCMAMLLRQLLPGEIDHQDNNKRTALHWASSYGNLDHVKMLIKQDSNIGIPDIEGKTPLHWAASSRDPDAVQCVRLILETTPSVINWQDYEGRTALHLAVADGNQSIVDLLTSVEKCNVSALDNVFRTPLHWAAVLGHSKVVEQLLHSNADPTSSDSNGATPLHYAAQNNFDETVNVFLTWKNMDEPDLEGRTAFMWAAGKGADSVLRVFFQHSVDVLQEDKTGGTALHAAALSGHAGTVQLLLQHGARINATDQAKHSPLFRACEMGHTDVAQTLIDHGARVDVLDEDGRSPLHWAALGGHAYICQILIKYGVDPNIRDHSGRSPLHCAAYGGYVNCMSALMEHQADPNTQDKEGMACLHWACSKGHLDAVKLLVENNAFPNHMEFREDRYTPLDYALMGEHHDVAQYMIEQGALSITGIQDIAATKIQSAFRGYRVRKTFIERKKLLMKHEMLKKEAARKRAGEGRRSEEVVKREFEDGPVDSPAVSPEHTPLLQAPPHGTQLQTQKVVKPPQEAQPDQPLKNESPKSLPPESEVQENPLPEEPLPQEESQSPTQERPPLPASPSLSESSHKSNFTQQKPSSATSSSSSSQQRKTADHVIDKPQSPPSSPPQQPQQQKPPSPKLPPSENSSQSSRSSKSASSQRSHRRQHRKHREKGVSSTTSLPGDHADPHPAEQGGESSTVRDSSKTRRPSTDSRTSIRKEKETSSVAKAKEKTTRSSTEDSGGRRRRKKEREPTCEERVLQGKTEREKVKTTEKQRRADFQRKQDAAKTIQRAWRKHRQTRHRRQEKIFADSAQKAVRLRRIQASQAEWEKQIAALTIQLAWRKFFRRKLLRSLNPNRRQLKMWDPEIVALKQQALIAHIYSEQLMVPFWHPNLKPAVRPFWMHLIPSPAAVSFNFAVDQYHPYKSWQGMRPHSWTGPMEDTLPIEYTSQSASTFRPQRSQNSQFSYNLRKA